MLRKSIVRLSMAVFTGVDALASMPVAELQEIIKEVLEVNKQIGKK